MQGIPNELGLDSHYGSFRWFGPTAIGIVEDQFQRSGLPHYAGRRIKLETGFERSRQHQVSLRETSGFNGLHVCVHQAVAGNSINSDSARTGRRPDSSGSKTVPMPRPASAWFSAASRRFRSTMSKLPSESLLFLKRSSARCLERCSKG